MSDQNSYNDEIYQLDGLIANVYDAFYTKINNYKIKFIDVENSKLDRFKMSDYNLDLVFNKIIYRGTYPTGIVIKGNNIEEIHFKRLGETHASTIRIVPYIDVEKIDDKTDPINVNQIMKTILSELVAAEKTNGVLLPIINIDVSGSDLLVYDQVAQYINPKLYYSLQITEKYYKLITLDDFFKNYALESKILKSIIYQAIDVLYQINISYPEFRYNQLVPDKIDCYLKNTMTLLFLKLN
nr:divergent kinase [Mimivirus sp.]